LKSPNGQWPDGVSHGALRFAAYLARHDRRLLREYVRWALNRGQTPGEVPPLDEAIQPISPEQARRLVTELLGEPDPGPALTLVRTEAPRSTAISKDLVTMAGDMSLGELLYVLVRRLRPELVIETGVAHGITSAYLLAGLADNDHGQLHSIDLPTRAMIRAGLVGAAVPDELRGRWTYHWAPSRRVLPTLLQRTDARCGLFVHDSDHSYPNMRWELEQAWAAAAPGAWVVADDAQLHNAFQDVARTVGAEPIYVSQDAKQGWTALMSKPAM
jgi:predicted O-methyltransferase YrrM